MMVPVEGNASVETPAADEPHVVDVHVGQRVRLRRKYLGLTQENLANALGLTFQQVQKYERGTNRISASKLFETARFLKVPVSYFFEGLTSEDGGHITLAGEVSANRFLATAEGLELAAAFPHIRSGKRRRKVLDLVIALSEA